MWAVLGYKLPTVEAGTNCVARRIYRIGSTVHDWAVPMVLAFGTSHFEVPN